VGVGIGIGVSIIGVCIGIAVTDGAGVGIDVAVIVTVGIGVVGRAAQALKSKTAKIMDMSKIRFIIIITQTPFIQKYIPYAAEYQKVLWDPLHVDTSIFNILPGFGVHFFLGSNNRGTKR
jgi:hypothetical protein